MLIEVFQDTVCPWCRIGKRHLELALERWQGEPLEVRYRTFFLNPGIPPEGMDFRTLMNQKGGGTVPLEQFFDAPRQMGEKVGLLFNFEKIARAPNSQLSNRLIALVPEDQRVAIIDAVYAAYFEHGQDIGQMDVLLAIVASQGLNVDRIREQLTSGAALDQVQADARWAQMNGIQGVPFFVFDQQYGISGAQPPEVLLEVMKEVIEKRQNE
jgi:predicted DsbA family dithiol-disulfide isomerase